MNIFEIELTNWYTICINFNWLALLAFAIILIIVLLIKPIIKMVVHKHVSYPLEVDEVALGIGNSVIKLKPNKKDQEIAYKLWVELNTRKIGLVYDEELDVIDEIYNSWYAFFKATRELLKEIPYNESQYSAKLITITTDILNEGLRPHLTKWQAKYRKWYKTHAEDDGSPQQIQRTFPEYTSLVSDLKKTTEQMIEYKKLIYKIAFSYSNKKQ